MLGFGAGIAQGYATLGQIDFSERSCYTAIGTVCNLAARLCAEAKDGQILVSSRIAEAVEAVARLENLGNLELRGLRRPVAAFNVVQSTSVADARPNLTVVARGPGPTKPVPELTPKGGGGSLPQLSGWGTPHVSCFDRRRLCWRHARATRLGVSPEDAERQDFALDSPRGNAIC